MPHLPLSPLKWAERGWDQLDFLFVSGDAYVDHPSFGAALLCRLLESEGYGSASSLQPSLDDPHSLLTLGRHPVCSAFIIRGG
jgi:hypothetical protein